VGQLPLQKKKQGETVTPTLVKPAPVPIPAPKPAPEPVNKKKEITDVIKLPKKVSRDPMEIVKTPIVPPKMRKLRSKTGQRDRVANLFMKTVFENEGGSAIDFDGRKLLKLGITEVRKAEVDKAAGRTLPIKEAALAIAKENFIVLSKNITGFDALNTAAQVALVDLSYAMGPAALKKMSKLTKAIAAGDIPAAMKETLDTANAGSKSLKGIAVRRARMYNAAVLEIGVDRIVKVGAFSDGRITYSDAKDRIIFSYKPPKGKHPDSIPGEVPL